MLSASEGAVDIGAITAAVQAYTRALSICTNRRDDITARLEHLHTLRASASMLAAEPTAEPSCDPDPSEADRALSPPPSSSEAGGGPALPPTALSSLNGASVGDVGGANIAGGLGAFAPSLGAPPGPAASAAGAAAAAAITATAGMTSGAEEGSAASAAAMAGAIAGALSNSEVPAAQEQVATGGKRTVDEAFGEQGDDSSTPADDEEEFGEDA